MPAGSQPVGSVSVGGAVDVTVGRATVDVAAAAGEGGTEGEGGGGALQARKLNASATAASSNDIRLLLCIAVSIPDPDQVSASITTPIQSIQSAHYSPMPPLAQTAKDVRVLNLFRFLAKNPNKLGAPTDIPVDFGQHWPYNICQEQQMKTTRRCGL